MARLVVDSGQAEVAVRVLWSVWRSGTLMLAAPENWAAVEDVACLLLADQKVTGRRIEQCLESHRLPRDFGPLARLCLLAADVGQLGNVGGLGLAELERELREQKAHEARKQ